MKQVAKTTKNSKAREAMIREAIDAMKVSGEPRTIEALRNLTGYVDGRALSAALRVARRDGRVLFDGKRYSLPASAPTTTPAPPPFSDDGPLTRVDDAAPVTPTMPSPRAATIVPPAPLPAWVKDGTEVTGIGPHEGKCGVLDYSTARLRWTVYLNQTCVWVGETELVPQMWKPTYPEAALPAWLREGQRVRGIGQRAGLEGVLHDVGFAWRVEGAQWTIGKAVLDGIEKEWAPVYAAREGAPVCPRCGFTTEWCHAKQRLTAGFYCPRRDCPQMDAVAAVYAPQPAPGFARDLADKQAFGFTTARERIAAVLTRAGLTEATDAQPGVIVRVERDGRIGLRWGVKHADGSTASCAWTEHAERLLERASSALHGAGYAASVGAPQERAPAPSEATEFAALVDELAATRAALVRLEEKAKAFGLALVAAIGGAS